MPLGSACMTEAAEIGHMSGNVRLSPLSHGHPALKDEGKRWKGKGYIAKNEVEVQLPTRCPFHEATVLTCVCSALSFISLWNKQTKFNHLGL